MDRYGINGGKYASRSGERAVVGSWLAIAVLLTLGGLYLLQRKRANILISRNVQFLEYEDPKLSFHNGTSEVFAFSKFHGLSDDGVLPDLESQLGSSKVRHLVNLSFCLTPATKRNSDKTASSGTEYEDVFQCGKLSPSTSNIFFLETSCAGSRKRTPTGLNLTSKQSCSIYSAAHHNPNRKVVLLFTCPLASEFYTLTKNWVKTLWNLPNFYFGQVDLEDFYANTSLLEFHREVQECSDYHVVHQADLLRLYVLYRYGGTYMDLDVISLRPLDDLGENFIGFERSDSVNNAVMNLEPRHQFLEMAFSKAMWSYSPHQWATIGPNMMTNMIRKCNTSANFDCSSSLHVASCNITVLPVKVFYAVTGGNWSYFYDETVWPKFKEMLNESYVTHYWNHLGSHPLIIGSNQPLIKLAEEHCAGVYNVSGEILS